MACGFSPPSSNQLAGQAPRIMKKLKLFTLILGVVLFVACVRSQLPEKKYLAELADWDSTGEPEGRQA